MRLFVPSLDVEVSMRIDFPFSDWADPLTKSSIPVTPEKWLYGRASAAAWPEKSMASSTFIDTILL